MKIVVDTKTLEADREEEKRKSEALALQQKVGEAVRLHLNDGKIEEKYLTVYLDHEESELLKRYDIAMTNGYLRLTIKHLDEDGLECGPPIVVRWRRSLNPALEN